MKHRWQRSREAFALRVVNGDGAVLPYMQRCIEMAFYGMNHKLMTMDTFGWDMHVMDGWMDGSSTDFSFQNLVFGNLFEFSATEIT
jgi:hypothetical protein